LPHFQNSVFLKYWVITLRIPFTKRSTGKSGLLAVVPSGGNRLLVHVAHQRSDIGLPRITAAYKIPAAEFSSGDRLSRWKKTPVSTLLSAGEYQILQMEAPQVPRQEWKTALQWSLQDHLDFPVANASFDVFDIPTEEYMPGRQRMVYVVAAQNDVIQSVMKSFDSTGLDLAVIDTPGMALRNISALLEMPNQGQACLYFDNDKGLLVVTFRGELYDFRSINISLKQLSDNDKEQRNQLFERISLELQRTFDALDRQYGFIHIGRLSLAHRNELSGLPKYLKDNLYVPVDLLNLQGKVDIRDCPSLQQPVRQSRYLLAIGAALRGDSGQ
jgi:MSHA biogenesis protein MshI